MHLLLTPRELQKYAEAVVGGDFLSKELHERQLNDMIVLSPHGAYGLCLLRRGSFYGHNGAVPGYTSSMYHSNEKLCTFIIYFGDLRILKDQLIATIWNCDCFCNGIINFIIAN